MKTVVLGVTAGIAAYKACEILRELQKADCDVHVILTERAQSFVGPVTFQYLSRNRVITGLMDLDSGGYIEHIRLARTADLFLVAPATADAIGKMANGIADEFLTTFYLATEAKTLVAPAMNAVMWNHPPVQRNLQALRDDGVEFVDPEAGDLACGETGVGRLAPVPLIVDRALQLLGSAPSSPTALSGKTVLITAGPTQEDLDPVRTLTSRSTGRMGVAIANAATARGAYVVFVHGPLLVPPPHGAENVSVRSAIEMRDAVLDRLDSADVVIGAAAVSDFRPAERSDTKLKKLEGETERDLRLVRNPDVLAEASRVDGRAGRVFVGFALETEDLETNGRAKLESKNLDLLVANPIGSMGGSRTEAVLMEREGALQTVPSTSKEALAERILDAVEARLGALG